MLQGCPGEFATIFSVWINGVNQDMNLFSTPTSSTYLLKSVDCSLTWGTVKISQRGSTTPSIVPDSYVKSALGVSSQLGISWLWRIYADAVAEASTYHFSATAVATMENDLFNSPLATLLLSPGANVSATTVARRIVSAFDMATLMAFSRSPESSALTLMRTNSRSKYLYDSRVLLILLVPLCTTILGCWGRWRVGSAEEVVGYDPVEVARRGPVVGLDGRIVGIEQVEDKEVIDEMELWGEKEGVLLHGTIGERWRIVIARAPEDETLLQEVGK